MTIPLIIPLGFSVIVAIWLIIDAFTLFQVIPGFFDEAIIVFIALILWTIFFIQATIQNLISSFSGILTIIVIVLITGGIIYLKYFKKK